MIYGSTEWSVRLEDTIKKLCNYEVYSVINVAVLNWLNVTVEWVELRVRTFSAWRLTVLTGWSSFFLSPSMQMACQVIDNPATLHNLSYWQRRQVNRLMRNNVPPH